jgi:DNA-binding response OmpR family regulator
MSKKGRTAEKSSSVLEVGGLTLDLDRRLITGDNGAHRLTPMECRLLKTLMTYSGRVMSRKFLMRKVWETDYLGDTRTLDVHICWLRKKIEEDTRNPRYIKTVRGTGYRFGEGGGDNSERGLD